MLAPERWVRWPDWRSASCTLRAEVPGARPVMGARRGYRLAQVPRERASQMLEPMLEPVPSQCLANAWIQCHAWNVVHQISISKLQAQPGVSRTASAHPPIRHRERTSIRARTVPVPATVNFVLAHAAIQFVMPPAPSPVSILLWLCAAEPLSRPSRQANSPVET
jgi:hypothetical protein